MSDFHNYDPSRIVATFAGILIRGYADGTFIGAERAEDAFAKSVGAQGDVTRIRNRDRSGMVTFTLQAESPSNDQLTAKAVLDELFGTGTGALLVKDLNGTTLLHAEVAWIRKLPNVEYAKDGGSREWVIDCAELEMSVGGAVV